MGADVYLGKGAVVLRLAVMCTLGNGTADALVCVHIFHLTFCDFNFIICCSLRFIQMQIIWFWICHEYNFPFCSSLNYYFLGNILNVQDGHTLS